MGSASPPDDNGDQVALAEWQSTRDLLNAFDDRIHDLHKYGFTFITALLTAQSLLLPSLAVGVSQSSSGAISDWVKLGVLSVTFILIVALREVETVYQLYQKAGNIRSVILERRLDLELSETITGRHEKYHVSWRISAIYFLFALADALLGTFILDTLLYGVLLWVFFACTVGAILWIGRSDLYYKRGEEDWTLDRTACEEGEVVKITLTNLSKKERIEFAENDVVYGRRMALKAEDGSGPSSIETVRAQGRISIPPRDDYSWLWDTKDAEPGIYQIYPSVSRGWVEKLEKQAWEGEWNAAKELGLPTELPAPPLNRWLSPVALFRKVTVTPEQPTAPGETPSLVKIP
jgi:hypothetical protein